MWTLVRCDAIDKRNRLKLRDGKRSTSILRLTLNREYRRCVVDSWDYATWHNPGENCAVKHDDAIGEPE